MATLSITGKIYIFQLIHVRDTVMILVNNVLVSNALTLSDRLDTFGYWRIENGNIILTTEDQNGATLDLIVENWGRVGFGDIYHQYKGLVDANRVFLNNEELTSWTIYPLEFKRSWNQNFGDWGPVDRSVTGPALYKAILTIDDDDITDTYIDHITSYTISICIYAKVGQRFRYCYCQWNCSGEIRSSSWAATSALPAWSVVTKRRQRNHRV
jgi:hypothetical protein